MTRKLSGIITREDVIKANEKLMILGEKEISEKVKECPIPLSEEEINSYFSMAYKQVQKEHPEYNLS